MGSSGGAHAEVCAAIHGAGRTVGIEAATRSRAAYWQEFCLLCEKGATAGHLATENHSKAVASWGNDVAVHN